MIPPVVNLVERVAAQISLLARAHLFLRAKAAILGGSATVPSFYAADTHKTCYPSPIGRSVVHSARPPFFIPRGMPPVAARFSAGSGPLGSFCSSARPIGVGYVRNGISTGDLSKCGPHSRSRPFSRPVSRLPAASTLISNARASGRLQAVLPRQPWAAVLSPVPRQGLRLARSVMSSRASAGNNRRDLAPVTHLISNPTGRAASAVFCVVRRSHLRWEGSTICSRNC